MPKLIVRCPPPADVTTVERRHQSEHPPMDGTIRRVTLAAGDDKRA
jgi:hypothetical protein